MYDDLDEDFVNSYDAKKAAEKALTPWFPYADYSGAALLKRVKRDKSPKKGKFYEFKFQITKSDNPLVVEGASYIVRYYQGASDVSNEMCWRNMLPILMAGAGATDILTFNAPEALGTLLAASKEGDLDLPVGHVRKMEEAKPDKDTGKVDPKHINKDGTVKKYPRDQWSPKAQ